MTRIRSRLLLATVVASLSMASFAEAQGGGRAAPGPGAGQGAGMMRRGGAPGGPGGEMRGAGAPRANPAAMMLRMRSQLQLTDDQVQKLEALQAAPAPRANQADLLRARADLLEATQGDGNLSKARTALDRMSALRNERMVAVLRQRQEARAVLTAQQKTQLDDMRGQLRQRGVARGQRGMMGPRGQMAPGGGRGMGPGAARGQFRGQPGPGAPMQPGMNRGMGRPGMPLPPA
jgi:Spy/CpxP family protein refolding chaperone